MIALSDKKKAALRGYVICFFLVLLFLGADCHFEMELDSYVSFVNDDTWKWMLHGNGRVIDAAIFYVFETLAIPPQVSYVISYTAAVLFLSLSVFLYSVVIERSIHAKQTVCIFLSFICIVNPHIVGYFMYIEKGLMNGAILLAVCGCFFLERFAREKRKRDILLSLVCVVLTAFIYQIVLGFFVILCIPVVVAYATDFLSFQGYGTVTLAEYGIASVLNFVYTILVEETERVGSAGSMIKEAIHRFFRVYEKLPYTFADAYENMRPNLYPYFFILSIVIVFGTLLVLKFEDKRFYLLYLGMDCLIVYLAIAISLVPWMLDMVECQASRTAYPCFSIAGSLLIYVCVLLRKNEIRVIPGWLQQLGCLAFGCFMLVYLFVQWNCTIKFFEDKYARNAIDCYEAIYIQDRIDAYEEESGQKVEKIVIYVDQNVSCNYFTMWSGSSVNPYTRDFTDVEVLNYFTGRDYRRGDYSAECGEFFGSNDWNSFHDEMFRFEGDTLHFCIF